MASLVLMLTPSGPGVNSFFCVIAGATSSWLLRSADEVKQRCATPYTDWWVVGMTSLFASVAPEHHRFASKCGARPRSTPTEDCILSGYGEQRRCLSTNNDL
eukprot:scpid56667/ scgid27728/ 